jgi:hypothetical protein
MRCRIAKRGGIKGHPTPRIILHKQKFFGSFSQKRTAFFGGTAGRGAAHPVFSF